MSATTKFLAIAGAGVLAATAVVLYQTERPPMDTVQHGYRGLAMEQVYNPRLLATAAALNQAPPSLPQSEGGPPAGTVYQNVKVLNNVSVGEFTRLMVSITNWVAPTQGCVYCHNVENMADDSHYTKVVARRMIQMVQHVNADWKTHVAQTGVTCWTCHRGNPVPQMVWFNGAGAPGAGAVEQAGGFAQMPAGKNHPATAAGDSALPFDPYTPFLEQDNNIRVGSTTALPSGNPASIKQTEWTYALMMSMSQALGVNCTYCHNTRSFFDWDQSTPQRATAYYGIRMVRDLNDTYLRSLQGVLPPARLGPHGDVAKVNCATCHQGVYKPLFGVSMVQDFPELQHPTQ